MARPARTIAATASLLLLIVCHLSLAVAGDSPDPTPWGRPTPAMVLPLVLSFPNSSHVRSPHLGPFRQRHLQKAEPSRARMRLYDDLLTNGYYTTRLYIGTPPQEFALIVDSGSTVTYVPCSTCERCGKHQDPRFQPEQSSSYEPVPCGIDCTCDKETNQCVYERQYAEMSSSSGVLGTDIVSFGNMSALEPQRVEFGCENMETGDIFSQHADGIMGLGRGPLSIVDQLVDKNVISDSFSLCYGGMDIGGGAMVLGSIPSPPEMVFSHSDPVRSPYYNIELKEIHVSGHPLKLNPSVFNSRHGTVLDSGTTYAYLPHAAFVAFRDAILARVRSIKQIPGPDPTYKDICFSGAGSEVSQLSEIFPEVEMVFSNDQKISLSPENYLFRHSKVHGAYCLGVFQNGQDPTALLGGIVVRNTLVTYDRENQRIGFWKTNCSELWERLRSHGAPSPSPSDSSHWNLTLQPSLAPSSEALQPSLAPSSEASHIGSQNDNMTGPTTAGLLTLYILLNVTCSNFVPHISEFAELIAHDLELNSSQVQILSIKGEGNANLVRLAIFPVGIDTSYSNATIRNIISCLAEHCIHLSENFGAYELLEWKVEPISPRTWWQQNVIAVVLGVAVILLLSLGTILGWFFWRRTQTVGAYRPVDAPVPEQELQPLQST